MLEKCVCTYVCDVQLPLSYLACLACFPMYFAVQLWSWGTPWALYWKVSPPAQTTSMYQGTLHVLLTVVFPPVPSSVEDQASVTWDAELGEVGCHQPFAPCVEFGFQAAFRLPHPLVLRYIECLCFSVIPPNCIVLCVEQGQVPGAKRGAGRQ